jgi:PKD repeat protein
LSADLEKLWQQYVVSPWNQFWNSVLAPPSPAPVSPYQGAPPSPLSVSVNASPGSGPAPLSVLFSASPSGGTPPYSFNWDFGDGTTSQQQNPSHTFESIGSFTVTLTVVDGAGDSAKRSVAIVVTGGQPSLSQPTPPPPPNQPPWTGQQVIIHVDDEKTRKAIPGASVKSNTGDVQITNSDGDASFPEVENGVANYFFKVAATGYYDQNFSAPPAQPGTYDVHLVPIPEYILTVDANMPASSTGYYIIKTQNATSGSEFPVGPGETGAANVAAYWAGKGYSVWVAPATAPSNPSAPPIEWVIKPTGPFVQVYNAGPYAEPFGST